MRSGLLGLGIVAFAASLGCGGDGGNDNKVGDGGAPRSGGTSGAAGSAGGSSGQRDGGSTLPGPSAAGTSGAPSAVMLGMLNADQRTKVCNWTVAKVAEELPLSCTAKAVGNALSAGLLSDAALRKTCHSIYDDCVMQGAAVAVCNTPPSDCTATVGEFESCWKDQMAAITSFIGQIPTCDTITVNYDPSTAPDFQAPASCTAYNSKCQAYVPGQETSAPAACVKFVTVLCTQTQTCSAGADGGASDLNDCIAEGVSAGGLDCQSATKVSPSFEMCLAAIRALSCTDFNDPNTPAPPACSKVLQ